jgi:hypothetical protein
VEGFLVVLLAGFLVVLLAGFLVVLLAGFLVLVLLAGFLVPPRLQAISKSTTTQKHHLLFSL